MLCWESPHTIRNCPNPDCTATTLPMPSPGSTGKCAACESEIFTSDALRIHEQFVEHQSSVECHIRVMQTLEILALANSLRCLTKTEDGLDALRRTAFVMDGQLAAFGNIAVLGQAIRRDNRQNPEGTQRQAPRRTASRALRRQDRPVRPARRGT